MSRILASGVNQITCTYAKHCSNVKANKAWAKGVDIVKKKSQPDSITAHSAGRVIKVIDYLSGTNRVADREGMGYGNYVMIQHDDNYVTLYAHLEKVNIIKGQLVNAGHVIGYMGNTGNSTGVHLHFELRKYKAAPDEKTLHDVNAYDWLDPTDYLDKDLPYKPAEKKYYRVQIGSYVFKDNAVRRAKDAKSKGFDVIIKCYNRCYRVQVGAYSNKLNANKMLKKVKAAGYGDAYVTTEGGSDVSFS